MNEKRMLEWFRDIDLNYIEEAAPGTGRTVRFWTSKMIVAACIGLLFVGGGVMSRFTKTPVEAKYYSTSIDEVKAAYDGELLVEKISYEGASDTSVMLCYTGEELPVSSNTWKTLSVSASYEAYDMAMNCAFNGETFAIEEEHEVDTIQYGDTKIKIYQGEMTPEFELTYCAVFEYQNVCYELKTFSNDKKFIYEILETVLGASKEHSDRPAGEKRFTEVLGYRDYSVAVEQTMPGFITQKYYAEVDGVETCIAQAHGYVVPGLEVYSRDLDGDGVNELICNCIYGTGAERVYVFRNRDGVIEKGRISYEEWDVAGITELGAGYYRENYIAKTDTFEVEYDTEEGVQTVAIEDMEVFTFEKFVEEF